MWYKGGIHWSNVLGNTVAGWTSTICVVCLLGGIQLISLGVIGQYVGKTYLETKRRPRYIIRQRTWEKPERRWLEEGTEDFRDRPSPGE